MHETFTAAVVETMAPDLAPSPGVEGIFDIDYEITEDPMVDSAIDALPAGGRSRIIQWLVNGTRLIAQQLGRSRSALRIAGCRHET